jgi:methylornithine synthase
MTTSLQFDDIMYRSLKERPLTRSDIHYLLSIRKKKMFRRLFEVARTLRQRYFNNSVFLYGFVYFSTYCRNNCSFCYNRYSNSMAQRYRKDKGAILQACRYLAESGVHCIDLTMGEDPFFYQSEERFLLLEETIESLKHDLDIPIMLSPGAIPKTVLSNITNYNITWFACYQETHNRDLFKLIRPHQSYEYRLKMKYLAKELGLLIEEGILTGIGESSADVVESLMAMKHMRAQQIRVMRFVPQEGTPMYSKRTSDSTRELVILAILRLLFPDRLIPASLDIDGIKGLQTRLMAGANVITSLVPPLLGLSGVAQPALDINIGNRSVESVIPVLKAAGLVPASLREYTRWITNEQERMRTRGPLEKEAVS